MSRKRRPAGRYCAYAEGTSSLICINNGSSSAVPNMRARIVTHADAADSDYAKSHVLYAVLREPVPPFRQQCVHVVAQSGDHLLCRGGRDVEPQRLVVAEALFPVALLGQLFQIVDGRGTLSFAQNIQQHW